MKVTAALDTLYSAVYESFTIYLHYIQRLVGKYHVYGIFNPYSFLLMIFRAGNSQQFACLHEAFI